LGNPFKKISQKSKETKKVWGSDNKQAGAKTRCCEQCGAPRPQATNLTTCAYCGFKFMDISVEIKNKP
jgi:hypothetical protein